MIDVSYYVAQKIKYYRKLRRMTQKELGERVGVKHNTISSYENGINEPEQDLLFKIADVLDININELFPPTNYDVTNMKIAVQSDMVRIPVIGTIACGDPILADENIIGYRYHLRDRLPKGQTFYLTAKGDSIMLIAENSAYPPYIITEQTPARRLGKAVGVSIDL